MLDALRCIRRQCPRKDGASPLRGNISCRDFYNPVRKPPSASVHAGVKREKIPAAVDVHPRGQLYHPGVLRVWWVDVLTRRDVAHGCEKRGRRGTRCPSSCSLSARMFACYYCQQIPTSRTADAHYNCKRGLARSGSLARRRRNIRMHWDVHSEVSRFHDFPFFDGWPSTPFTFFYSDDARPV